MALGEPNFPTLGRKFLDQHVQDVLDAFDLTASDLSIDLGNMRVQIFNRTHTVSAGTTTHNLPAAFANTNYAIFATVTNQNNFTWQIINLSTTQFQTATPVAGTPNLRFIAIGNVV